MVIRLIGFMIYALLSGPAFEIGGLYDNGFRLGHRTSAAKIRENGSNLKRS